LLARDRRTTRRGKPSTDNSNVVAHRWAFDGDFR
jgi:hypothetical protein